jgi:prefoldin subunit 5
MLSDRYIGSTRTEIERLKKRLADLHEKIEELKAKTYPIQASIERLEETIAACAEVVDEDAGDDQPTLELELTEQEGVAA